MCRELRGRGLHTFQGMVGYCSKDIGLIHWDTISKNVSQEDISTGSELYVHYGSPEDMKKRVVLNANNIFSRAATFQKYRSRHPLDTYFPECLG